MPFPLQDTKSHQATDHMMLLGALRARLTAGQAELIFTDSNHLLNLGADAIHPADLGSWHLQAIGGVVLLAVSDNQYFQPPAELADLGPVRMAPMVTERLPIEAAIILEASHEVPPIVANVLEQGFGGVPGIKEHILGLATQPIPGIAQQLQGERVL
jgi:hypothetical protein